MRIQTVYRGYMVRALFSVTLAHRLEESQRFSSIWGRLVQLASKVSSSNWSSIRERVSDIKHVQFEYDDAYFDDTDEKLSNALEGALQVQDFEGDCPLIEENADELKTSENQLGIAKAKVKEVSKTSWLTFQMTRLVSILCN